jgi:hypothetical protein
MTLNPVAGFHKIAGHHCVTTSLRHIYLCNDHPISEEMLLGLGAGLGFMYWHQAGTTPFLGGRGNKDDLERDAGRRTGVGVETHETSSAHKAEQSLVELLEAGQPVMVYLDMGFLPYFNFPEEYHFGGHTVVIAGYDPDTRQVLVSDRDDELHPVSMDDLAQARGSTFKPFPPRHRWLTFDFGGKRPPGADDVRDAIRAVVTAMLEPPIRNFGVAGICTAAARVAKWPQTMNDRALREACFNAHIFISPIGGTGGGLFRYMYARFLREAAEIAHDPRLAEAADRMQHIGDRWMAVDQIFLRAFEAPDPAVVLAETTAPLLELADLEEQVMQDLRVI